MNNKFSFHVQCLVTLLIRNKNDIADAQRNNEGCHKGKEGAEIFNNNDTDNMQVFEKIVDTPQILQSFLSYWTTILPQYSRSLS
jgi:hypothetical protein